MLAVRGAAAALLLALLGVVGLSAAPQAAADYVYCPPAGGPCVVVVTTPGGPGGGGGGGGSGGGGCTWNGRPIDCYDTVLGWYAGGGCYYKQAADQTGPPTGAGIRYMKTCKALDGGFDKVTYERRLTPPPQVASPAEAAARAINLLGLTGPEIGIVPKPGSQGGLVGLPVWLWTRVAPTTWGPNSATASLPGVSVTAKANASKIVWNMGDGHSVTCTNPGMAYNEIYGKQPSPRCGYAYATPGRYTVTGTTYWHVTWAGGGQTGALDVQRSSSTQIVIGELQVLVQ